MKISSSDLKYSYYTTVTNFESQPFTGKPDPVLFNRMEEYEVIPMLERVMDELNTQSLSDLHKLEDIIKHELLGVIRKREDIFDFLVGKL